MKYALRLLAWRALDDEASSRKRWLLSHSNKKSLQVLKSANRKFIFSLCTFLKRDVHWLFHIFGLCFLKPNQPLWWDAFNMILQVYKTCSAAEFLHHSTVTPETINFCHQRLYISQLQYPLPQTASRPHLAIESPSSHYPVFCFFFSKPCFIFTCDSPD